MRITIERLRTLVLILGGLLVVAIAVFLTVSHFRNRAKNIDIPKRLGVNITEQADHVIYTQTHAGHALFKIDAVKVVQVSNGVATLSDVKIDLYGAEGSRVDRIEGKEFEYDQKAGIARAIGPVEITLMKPGQAPAIAPKANPLAIEEKSRKSTTLTNAVATAETGDIRVKTSGLVFDQKTGVAQTSQKADFILAQGEGSGIGALFDSQKGHMVLDHDVELHIRRGTGSNAVPVDLRAGHAEFERGSMLCHLLNATLTQRATTASAAAATVLFREDGSADKLDASGGLRIASTNGTDITAPRGHLEFDVHNHPQRGHMEGGVALDSKSSRTNGNTKVNRNMHGTSPTAQLVFTSLGDLDSAHLERGVEFASIEDREQGTQKNHLVRHWNSPIADLKFQKDIKGGTTIQAIHGVGGATIKAESQRTVASKIGPTLPARIAADDLLGIFNAKGALDSMTGVGHAFIEQTTETGAHQSATGDKLDAHFSDDANEKALKNSSSAPSSASGLSNLDHATLVGHVILVQTPATNTTAHTSAAPVRATSGRAEYEGTGEWLHLTQSPRIENGGVEMTAERIDVSRASGDAFAHTNVKATWVSEKSPDEQPRDGKKASEKSAAAGFGGQGPAHVISAEAEMKQSTSDAIFRGQARLWQGSNSVSAPVITLNRNHQTLLAEAGSTKPTKPVAEQPVYAVFLSAPAHKSSSNQSAPQLMRFHGARLRYSAAERKAWLTASAATSQDANSSASFVTADTGSGQIQSDNMELTLLPVGTTAAPGNEGSASQVDHLIANGHVQLNSAGRHGTGERLIYSGESGTYTLTGTDANPPKLHDPTRGTVSGETLIFQSRDDSVKVEGPQTSTDTTTQK